MTLSCTLFTWRYNDSQLDSHSLLCCWWTINCGIALTLISPLKNAGPTKLTTVTNHFRHYSRIFRQKKKLLKISLTIHRLRVWIMVRRHILEIEAEQNIIISDRFDGEMTIFSHTIRHSLLMFSSSTTSFPFKAIIAHSSLDRTRHCERSDQIGWKQTTSCIIHDFDVYSFSSVVSFLSQMCNDSRLLTAVANLSLINFSQHREFKNFWANLTMSLLSSLNDSSTATNAATLIDCMSRLILECWITQKLITH